MNLFPEPAAQCKQPWQWTVQEMRSFRPTDLSYISGTGTPSFTALQTHSFLRRPALLSLLRQSICSHRKRSLLLQLDHHEAFNHLFVLYPRVSSHHLCCIVNRRPECKWCHLVCKTDPSQPRYPCPIHFTIRANSLRCSRYLHWERHSPVASDSKSSAVSSPCLGTVDPSGNTERLSRSCITVQVAVPTTPTIPSCGFSERNFDQHVCFFTPSQHWWHASLNSSIIRFRARKHCERR